MLELTLELFETEVIDSEKPVLIDWWGETCETCIALMPMVEEMSERYGDRLKFTKFNTSQKGVRRFCIKHKIMGLPVITIYQAGEKVAELTKEDITRDSLEELIKKYI
ncbi:thioredoxin TrxA [Vagococcus intermedius]|uniref:Thioredoxin family protein n=1 Tax=Vagococcus intermedius TaxID=2991418 RepID=A0AAF0CW55_9ENTE|nr:thioredoxin family protein [Vagococcus intermedius]WEG74079.1 thioredoxin family protein [Vagococcus intermedius]WEG76159.1 thioredoxin family protein [Vagococcus intermedius]